MGAGTRAANGSDFVDRVCPSLAEMDRPVVDEASSAFLPASFTRSKSDTQIAPQANELFRPYGAAPKEGSENLRVIRVRVPQLCPTER